MKKIYDMLEKTYKLKGTQIRVLKALEGKNKNVRELVNDTKIPIGTIYEILKEMVHFNLIQVKKSPNKVYYIEDLSDNVMKFVDSQIEKQIGKREELIKEFHTNKGQKVYSYENYVDFKLGCLKYDPYPEVIYGFLNNFRFPLFFFPIDSKKYFECKMMISKYKNESFSKEKLMKNTVMVNKYKELEGYCKDVRWLVSRDEFNIYLDLIRKNFGEKERGEVLKNIKDFLRKNKNTNLRFYEKQKDYQFIVTSKTVQIQFLMSPLFIGLIIDDSNTQKVYINNFENIWKMSLEMEN